MLQQTRVAAVLAHYADFLHRFPTLQELAAAQENEVLAAWSGLGYYRRARMLHRAARTVVSEYDGILPNNSAGLLQLPGVGRYTANAIASIAYHEPVAVVDGNVERVIARLFGGEMTKARTWQRAQELLDSEAPGDFNQAMMELGATVCVPGVPLCGVCPVRASCTGRGAVKSKAARPEPRNRRSTTLLVSTRAGRILLRRRLRTESLMPGMWELPEGKSTGDATALRVKHSITSTDWEISVVVAPGMRAPRGARWIEIGELPAMPITGLTRKILRRLAVLA